MLTFVLEYAIIHFVTGSPGYHPGTKFSVRKIECVEKWMMKSMEINRKIDELGRVVLPVEARQVLKMEPGDTVSFYWIATVKVLH